MASNAQDVYIFHAASIDGEDVSLETYKGRVLLIVNVASNCGFTAKNYTQLQELHTKYAEKGLSILAFPCNQFGNLEPGTNEEIKAFAQGKYNAQFDMFSKINVNGYDALPLYAFLKKDQRGASGKDLITWNFSKFLVNREGMPVSRYAPSTDPIYIVPDIEKLL